MRGLSKDRAFPLIENYNCNPSLLIIIITQNIRLLFVLFKDNKTVVFL